MDGFIGEIRLFTGTYEPQGWLFCDGRLLNIQQYTPLGAVLGNIYGGDMSKNTFALPDLRGRVPIGVGQGAGLTNRNLNNQSGTIAETLTTATMPVHTHNIRSITKLTPTALTNNPVGNIWATGTGKLYATSTSPDVFMSPQVINSVGGNKTGTVDPHTNVQPCVAVNYIICYDGTFPVSD